MQSHASHPRRSPRGVTAVALAVLVALFTSLLTVPALAACLTSSCDTTRPRVAIGAPAGGNSVEGVVGIRGTASDDVALRSVRVSVDGAPSRVATGLRRWRRSVDFAAYSAGVHTLTVIATDAAGNRARTSTTVTVTKPAAASAPAGASVVQLGYFYRPPVGVSLDTLSAHSDRFVLTQLDEATRDGLRRRGETGPILQYLRFDAIMDDTGLGYTWHNQVAYKPGDWADISANHPDWFLRDSSGRRLRSGQDGAAENRFYMMDPANPGWRRFFVARMSEMQTAYGWNGVFLDNVEASLAKRERSGAVPAAYPTDASYQAAVKGFLVYLQAQYFGPQGRPVEANIIETRTDNDPVWHDYSKVIDGAMREGWAIGWDDEAYRSEWSWERELRMAEESQAAGKHVWLVAMGRQSNAQRQRFAYGSYLLVANGNASFRYTHWEHYDEVWPYANYAIALGAPLGPRYRSGSAWKRDFANGQVSVDPVSHVTRITVA